MQFTHTTIKCLDLVTKVLRFGYSQKPGVSNISLPQGLKTPTEHVG